MHLRVALISAKQRYSVCHIITSVKEGIHSPDSLFAKQLEKLQLDFAEVFSTCFSW